MFKINSEDFSFEKYMKSQSILEDDEQGGEAATPEVIYAKSVAAANSEVDETARKRYQKYKLSGGKKSFEAFKKELQVKALEDVDKEAREQFGYVPGSEKPTDILKQIQNTVNELKDTVQLSVAQDQQVMAAGMGGDPNTVQDPNAAPQPDPNAQQAPPEQQQQDPNAQPQDQPMQEEYLADRALNIHSQKMNRLFNELFSNEDDVDINTQKLFESVCYLNEADVDDPSCAKNISLCENYLLEAYKQYQLFCKSNGIESISSKEFILEMLSMNEFFLVDKIKDRHTAGTQAYKNRQANIQANQAGKNARNAEMQRLQAERQKQMDAYNNGDHSVTVMSTSDMKRQARMAGKDAKSSFKSDYKQSNSVAPTQSQGLISRLFNGVNQNNNSGQQSGGTQQQQQASTDNNTTNNGNQNTQQQTNNNVNTNANNQQQKPQGFFSRIVSGIRNFFGGGNNNNNQQTSQPDTKNDNAAVNDNTNKIDNSANKYNNNNTSNSNTDANTVKTNNNMNNNNNINNEDLSYDMIINHKKYSKGSIISEFYNAGLISYNEAMSAKQINTKDFHKTLDKIIDESLNTVFNECIQNGNKTNYQTLLELSYCLGNLDINDPVNELRISICENYINDSYEQYSQICEEPISQKEYFLEMTSINEGILKKIAGAALGAAAIGGTAYLGAKGYNAINANAAATGQQTGLGALKQNFSNLKQQSGGFGGMAKNMWNTSANKNVANQQYQNATQQTDADGNSTLNIQGKKEAKENLKNNNGQVTGTRTSVDAKGRSTTRNVNGTVQQKDKNGKILSTTTTNDNGTSTETKGNKTTTVAANGTKTEMIKQKDGSTLRIVTDKSGRVTREVLNPDGSVNQEATGKMQDKTNARAANPAPKNESYDASMRTEPLSPSIRPPRKDY